MIKEVKTIILGLNPETLSPSPLLLLHFPFLSSINIKMLTCNFSENKRGVNWFTYADPAGSLELYFPLALKLPPSHPYPVFAVN